MTTEAVGRTRARRNLRREILSARLRVTLDQKENKVTPEDIKLLAGLNLPPVQVHDVPEPDGETAAQAVLASFMQRSAGSFDEGVFSFGECTFRVSPQSGSMDIPPPSFPGRYQSQSE